MCPSETCPQKVYNLFAETSVWDVGESRDFFFVASGASEKYVNAPESIAHRTTGIFKDCSYEVV